MLVKVAEAVELSSHFLFFGEKFGEAFLLWKPFSVKYIRLGVLMMKELRKAMKRKKVVQIHHDRK